MNFFKNMLSRLKEIEKKNTKYIIMYTIQSAPFFTVYSPHMTLLPY